MKYKLFTEGRYVIIKIGNRNDIRRKSLSYDALVMVLIIIS